MASASNTILRVIMPVSQGMPTRLGLAVSALLCLLAVSFLPLTALAQEQENPEKQLKTFTFYWENDSVTGTDQDYSNGLKLTWIKPYPTNATGHRPVKDWIFKHLPFMQDPDSPRATAVSIGQYIYTPKDTERSDLIVEDRPYAGYTFMGFGFISRTGSRRNVWELEIGMIGPWSLAENTQNTFHDIIHTRRAEGWNHQLGNEPGLEAIYETKWRLGALSNSYGLGIDFIPHIGAQAGNVATVLKAGLEVRFGWFIPRDFGTCPIRPGCDAGNSLVGDLEDPVQQRDFSCYLFAATEGRAVLRDIFLDGNTFRDSHHVDKEIYVADLMGGIAMSYKRLKLSYALVLRTPEFKQRKDNHAFGTVQLSYMY